MHTFHVSLKVGEREFFGEGETMQAARHCAATMALNLLRTLPVPTREPLVESNTSEAGDETSPGKGNDLSHNRSTKLVMKMLLRSCSRGRQAVVSLAHGIFFNLYS